MSDVFPRNNWQCHVEVTERLQELLKEQCKFADRLQPAFKLAARQLEHQTPAVMGMSRRHGLVGTITANATIGTWLIVLATAQKVFTMHLLQPPPGFTRCQIVDQAVAYVTEFFGKTPEPIDTLTAIHYIVTTAGGAPGKATPQLKQPVCLQILGILFASMPPADRNRMIDVIEQIISEGQCPASVGLIGKGTKPRTQAGIWPLPIVLGPYIEHVDHVLTE